MRFSDERAGTRSRRHRRGFALLRGVGAALRGRGFAAARLSAASTRRSDRSRSPAARGSARRAASACRCGGRAGSACRRRASSARAAAAPHSCASTFTGSSPSARPMRFGDAQHVAIDRQPRHAERVAEHDVGGLAADARQLDQRVHVGRHLAAVLARRAPVAMPMSDLRLLAEEAGRRESAARAPPASPPASAARRDSARTAPA